MYLFCPQANCSLSLSFVCVFFPFFFKVFIGVQLLYWSIVPGGGNGNPLQCSRLDNPMDRGAWQFTVHRVTKSRTRLSTAHTAALQCCVSLCCKTKWTRYMYTHILSFGDPRLCHHGHWVQLPVLYRRFPLVISFIVVVQLCPSLCDPMGCSTPGFPVLYYLLELAQTQVH